MQQKRLRNTLDRVAQRSSEVVWVPDFRRELVMIVNFIPSFKLIYCGSDVLMKLIHSDALPVCLGIFFWEIHTFYVSNFAAIILRTTAGIVEANLSRYSSTHSAFVARNGKSLPTICLIARSASGDCSGLKSGLRMPGS